MQLIDTLSGIVILLFCTFLFGLGVMILIYPQRAEKFLNLYTSSARAHYTEQAARLVVGTAIVVLAPSLWHPTLLNIFGWILIITTIGLLLIPWRRHHRFGEWAIPLAIRYMKIYSLGAFGLGSFLLYCLSKVLVS